MAARGAGGAAPPSAAHSPLPVHTNHALSDICLWHTPTCHLEAFTNAVKVELHRYYDNCYTPACRVVPLGSICVAALEATRDTPDAREHVLANESHLATCTGSAQGNRNGADRPEGTAMSSLSLGPPKAGMLF